MKIAQISPIIESVPPKKYGGTERVISALTEGLVKRGHDVTLFASGDSISSAKIASVYPVSLREAKVKNLYGNNIWSLLNVGYAYQEQEKFDIIHDHNSQNSPISLPLANLAQTPVVMTLHGPLTNGNDKSFKFYTKPYLVSISKKQTSFAPNLNFIGNVYHGLPMEHYPFSRTHDGYLLFVGRLQVENGIEIKGLLNAIKVAEMVNMPLLIAAKLDENIPENVAYFNEMIKPHLSNKIRWLGEVEERERNNLMQKAYCVLHSINFAEPFGLTLIEAMGCGSPVIAFNKGSIPEIIKHGKTGFVVEDIYEMAESIKSIPMIDRLYCRSYALEYFSSEKMVKSYEEIYEKIISSTNVVFSNEETLPDDTEFKPFF